MGQPDTSSDDTVGSDHRIAAKDRSSRINDHMIAYVGMALPPLDRMAGLVQFKTFGSQGNSLIEFNMTPDMAGLADHDTAAVINEEISADDGPRVNIDGRLLMGVFRHHAGDLPDRRRKQP